MTEAPFRFGKFIVTKDKLVGWAVNCGSLSWHRVDNLAAETTEELLKELNASPLSGFKELETKLMQHLATLKQAPKQEKINHDLLKALKQNMVTVYQLGNCFVCKDKVMGWMISFEDGVWSSMDSISAVVLKSVMASLLNNPTVHACVPELREYLRFQIDLNEQKEKTELIDERHSEYTNVLRLAHSNVSILKSSLHKAEYELRVKSALLDFSKKTGDLSCLEVEPAGQQWCNNLQDFTWLLKVKGEELLAMRSGGTDHYSSYNTKHKYGVFDNIKTKYDTPFEWAVATIKRFW